MSENVGFFTNLKDGDQVTLWDDGTFLTLQARGVPRELEVSHPYRFESGYAQAIESAEMFVASLNHALLLAGYSLKLVAARDSGGIPAGLDITDWQELLRVYREEYEEDAVETGTWDTFVLEFRKL